MHNKGLIRLFAILFGLVCIYQLSYTYIASQIENNAEKFAQAEISENQKNYADLREEKVKVYLDSVKNEPYFIGITYEDAKNKELNKGLDLKGGINVILQISVKDILRNLANGSDDPSFVKALNEASQQQKNSQDPYVDLFFEAFDNIQGAKLASPNIFANKDLSDDINLNMTNEQVKPIIRRKIDESIVSAFEVIRERIDKFGVTQPNIQRLGDSGRILVELPGAKDISRIQKLLQSTAQLEFWEVYQVGDLIEFFVEADKIAAQNIAIQDSINNPEKEKVETQSDSTQTDQDLDELLDSSEDAEDEENELSKTNPLFAKLQLSQNRQSAILGVARINDTAVVNSYLRNEKARNLLKSEKRFLEFKWGKPAKGSEVIELYAIKGNRKDKPQLSGSVIVDANQTYTQTGEIVVSMKMNGRGSQIWEEMTTKAYENQTQIAIVLDNIVYSAPGVSNGPITGGNSQISGDFTITEAKDLANVLRAGKLPASADIIQSEIVGPSLGQEAIDSGINSFLIALVLVLLWMVFYYGKAGIYADIALIVNIVFIFGVLAGLKAVLTLPGIAGIVLTIGMSVDANVLIFERIKEELAAGKAQYDAIKDGFKNALSSILDANITTGLTGLILLLFGTGPIKGFATTLLIGILTSLFTAIFITRLFLDNYGKNNNALAFSTAATKNFLKDVFVNFLSKRKVAYIFSGALILVSIFLLSTKGLNQGVDFVGGRTYTVRFDQAVNANELEGVLIEELGSADIKTFGSDNQVKVTTNYKVDEEGIEIDEEIVSKMYSAFQPYLPDGLTLDNFSLAEGSDSEYGIMSSMKVGPTIADDIKEASFYAIIGSLIVVFLYILIRFRRWQFSVGAVVAVIHDTLIVLGIFSALYGFMPFSLEIDQAFIAAILTVIGYSLNDTVVVFDRIREYYNIHPKWNLFKIINVGASSTLSRTLNTSFTTLVVLLAIFIFGGDSIRGFMFALIIGVIVGTYSSVFIATPIMFDTSSRTKIDLSDKNAKKEDDEVDEKAKA
ncbi:protein translocase subunit SecDF [Mesohalobacter halotolerans]|uniref:Multifunctional fusion protein n=1 Tax=Mesohalobacter halotolerans TaxID=1883405 RepID=A0A4U5TPH8_9FLAO|nr:protein translocase subunit SecDF [Mesohalobacter halotolerans]TKS55876.1 protein translocase subunit SecDF [Mesohalobacter halotolerans]